MVWLIRTGSRTRCGVVLLDRISGAGDTAGFLQSFKFPTPGSRRGEETPTKAHHQRRDGQQQRGFRIVRFLDRWKRAGGKRRENLTIHKRNNHYSYWFWHFRPKRFCAGDTMERFPTPHTRGEGARPFGSRHVESDRARERDRPANFHECESFWLVTSLSIFTPLTNRPSLAALIPS